MTKADRARFIRAYIVGGTPVTAEKGSEGRMMPRLWLRPWSMQLTFMETENLEDSSLEMGWRPELSYRHIESSYLWVPSWDVGQAVL